MDALTKPLWVGVDVLPGEMPPDEPPPEPLTFTAFQLNARYPGFSSTPKSPSWAIRMPLLVARAKESKASTLIVQEMGADQAPGFFAAMGPGWHYDRAGLNVVGWNSDWTWQASNPLNLSSFGQMQRTLLAVNLAHATGKAVRLASTHLAAAASDLSIENAAKARIQQAQEILVELAEDQIPTLMGGDWNSTTTSTKPVSARPPMTPAGWVFDQTDITNDAKHGIDGTAANYGMSITSSQVVDLGIASDHDGRLVVATTQ